MSITNSIQVLSLEGGAGATQSVMQSILSSVPSLNVVAHSGGAPQVLDYLHETPVDIVLLDMAAWDDKGLGLTRVIRATHPCVRILVITASDAPDDIFDAMNAGADGYVLKGNVSQVLSSAIASVTLGTVWLDPAIARQVLQVVETRSSTPARVLPTGLMVLPLMPDEKSVLNEVAGSDCADGVCMVDPSFVRKLRRFSSRQAE